MNVCAVFFFLCVSSLLCGRAWSRGCYVKSLDWATESEDGFLDQHVPARPLAAGGHINTYTVTQPLRPFQRVRGWFDFEAGDRKMLGL